MVSISKQSKKLRIVLRPNRSMSWRGNQLVILSLLVISAFISVGFALLGAWVIMPFAGLEMMALSAALYYVSWKLSYCHVLEIDDDRVLVQKGVYYPKQSWTFTQEEVSFRVKAPSHEWDGPDLSIVRESESIPLGDFLNRQDRYKLVEQIRAEGFAVRAGQRGAVNI